VWFEEVLRNPGEKNAAIERLLSLLRASMALDEEQEYHVRLVMNELLANIFNYSLPEKVRMNAVLKDGVLTIVFQNNGQGFEYETVLERDVLHADPMCENGRGVYLVRLIADHLEYSKNGKRVKVCMNLDS